MRWVLGAFRDWAAVQARPVDSLTFVEMRECGSTGEKVFLLSVRVGDLIEQSRHIPKAHSAARNPHMEIWIRGQTCLQATL
jgi:hypothetical protein